MALRKRNSPGIEINEIDRSQYDKQTDYSLPNAPVCLVTGFADKGENYKTQWINSRNTFIDAYGIPNNTAEQYFYNAAIEILSHGGILLTHKLPYYNESKDKLSYVEYEFSKNKIIGEDIGSDYINIKETDNTLTSYIQLEKKNSIRTLTLDEYDKLLTYQNLTQLKSKAATSGKITIVNISNNKYEKTSWNSIQTKNNELSTSTYTNDCLGIVPIIVTASNALYYQKLLKLNINNDNDISSIIDQYSTISNVEVRTSVNKIDQTIFKENTCNDIYLNRSFKSEDIITNNTYVDNSWSKIFADYFPNITYNTFDTLDKEYLKNICIIVTKIFEDKTSNKLNFEILESFVGSVDRAAKDINTKSSIFIDNIVNSNSKYINVFTNIDKDELDNACFLTVKKQIAESMGFYEYECIKNIDYVNSIINPLNKLFSTFNNSTTTNIDIIVDAGISNIAQFLIGNNQSFNFNNEIPFENIDDIKKWRNVLDIFNTYCSFTRKDCIFLADSPRPLCLDGNQKKIRYTKPENTIENTIISKMKLISNINSSYMVGYCNWFYCPDQYTGDFFWCPPSIKAVGIYCDVDVNSYPWSAPAGVHRGKVFNTFDTAFSPTDDEAGKIYTYCWNYAINYPIDGIILEGQKTFQKNKTALDRINVRRLMLYLEKKTKRIARIFLYEGNTAFLRQKFVDTLKPIFEDVKNNYGISDYVIKCDEVNNTTETIERGELHVAIAVKPIKTVEYIVINFIVTNQSANVNEEVLQ